MKLYASKCFIFPFKGNCAMATNEMCFSGEKTGISPELVVPYTFCLFLILFILKKMQTFHAKFLFPGDGSLLLAYLNLLGTKGYAVVVG
jgi:hypothetical protein